MTTPRTIGEAARAVVERARKARRGGYQPFPRSEFGRRQLAAWARLYGISEAATRINWDLAPHRWAMEHEIEAARRVGQGIASKATEAAE